ncbi:MAG: redoxin domain-containing protein [Oligoflexia bacterium]|nr:redoxin domain-containing protein [Oligoflexia bacterium]
MLKKISAALLGGFLLFALPNAHAVQVGAAAPDFQGTDSNGHVHKLSSYRGKFVVLEWHNQGCPYVKKHYTSGNMQRLQKQWTKKGVVWLSILSSAPGKEGYVDGKQENIYLKKIKAAPTAAILDPTGAIGKLYGAKTTPHMFVINQQGKLIYNGAIDDKESTDIADVPKSRNYVSEALSAAFAGKAVEVPTTRPYGCGVKY